MKVPPDFQLKFPLLAQGTFHPASPATALYNCIAWAAGDNNAWWEPSLDGFWPRGVPRERTLNAYMAAFATRGYVPCADGGLRIDVEKIAIYVDFTGTPTHAARQLSDGTWTSKLGQAVDIVHTDPQVLNGPEYGQVVQFMSRTRVRVSDIAR